MINRGMIAALLCLLGSVLTAEEFLFKQQMESTKPIAVTIPASAITDRDVESGEITLNMTAYNKRSSWTIHCKPNLLYLTDAVDTETHFPLLRPEVKGYTFGNTGSGTVRSLTFQLPPHAKENGVTLNIPRGIYGSIHAPGPFDFELWKGLRLILFADVDKMNRGVVVDATSLAEEGVKFTYEVPGGFRRESETPACFIRFEENQKPFKVKVSVETRNDGVVTSEVDVVPRAEVMPMPRPQSEVLTGVACGNVEQYKKFVEEDLGNLIVQWAGRRLDSKDPYLNFLGENGYFYAGIYRSGLDKREDVERYHQIFGDRYLSNNIAEYTSYIYQGQSSAGSVLTDRTDMRDARDRFLQFISRKVRKEHNIYDYIMSTSGSTLADYEMMGGMDIVCGELYAIGAKNITFAVAEMRGAARKWKPEYWGGWLAEEWQTFGVPYETSQKYDLLMVGMYTNYMMGTNLIVLESGAFNTQAEKYTKTVDGKTGSPKQPYEGYAPTHYRKTMHDFRQFVKANPRVEGTPETHIAMLRGNLDGWLGMFHGGPMWAQHKTAKKLKQWLAGDPERSWLAAIDVFTPIFSDALKPYPNSWAGGVPYGQTDVVGLDEFIRPSDLARYQLAVIPGWNTMVPEMMTALNEYVQRGGTLVLSLPQFLTTRDHEATHYEISDLIGGGDLTGLIDVKVTGFVEKSGKPASLKPGGVESGKFQKEQLATAEIGKGVEVLATVGGNPYAVMQPRGQGKVVLLLGKEFPGRGGETAVFYKNLLHKLAKEVKQPVTIAPLPGKEKDVRAISFAVYPSRIYFLNTDCVASRTVNAMIDGKEQKLTLAPHEFRSIDRVVKPPVKPVPIDPPTAPPPGSKDGWVLPVVIAVIALLAVAGVAVLLGKRRKSHTLGANPEDANRQ